MSRYCIYLRKSRADLEAEAHGEGETLSRHKTALLELARRMGITISATYEEIVSGETIAARPQMQRLLSEVGAGEWDGVLVMEIERLARGDTMDQGLVAQTFKYSGSRRSTLRTSSTRNTSSSDSSWRGANLPRPTAGLSGAERHRRKRASMSAAFRLTGTAKSRSRTTRDLPWRS